MSPKDATANENAACRYRKVPSLPRRISRARVTGRENDPVPPRNLAVTAFVLLTPQCLHKTMEGICRHLQKILLDGSLMLQRKLAKLFYGFF